MTHEEFQDLAALDALGALGAEDERALRAHAESCADCRRAREEFGEAAAMLARGLDPVAPPGHVREAVFASVDPNLVPMEPRRGANPWWLATAATLFLALWGWREVGIRVSRERVESQKAEIESLRQENTRLQQEREKLSTEIASIAAADTQTIQLTGQQVSPSASAKVYLVPNERRAVVFFQNLPVNPDDKSYQLWIIRADKPAPESAGVFDISQSGRATITVGNLPVATEIKGLAVTLEPKGGVPQPTNTNFYVAGNT